MPVKTRSRNAIGVDVGGTKIAAGVMRYPEGAVLARRVFATEADRGGRAVLNAVLRVVREIQAEAKTQGNPAEVLGLGVCEIVSPDGQIMSDNCIAWSGLPVREELSAVLPAVIEADVRAAAVGEALFGAGRSWRNFLYVTVGTGISCCLMIDGQPYRGARGATGTMASSPVSIPCARCGHTSHRAIEEIAAGPALVTRFNDAGGSARSGRDVLLAAAAGNESANHVIESASEALASQLGVLVGTLDPEGVVIGGGLGLSDGAFFENLVSATRRHVWWHGHRDLPIVRAVTGADAGWLGAAARAVNALELRDSESDQ